MHRDAEPASVPGGESEVSVVCLGCMPGWQLAVTVTVVTLLVAMIVVVVHRVRAAQRNRVVPAT